MTDPVEDDDAVEDAADDGWPEFDPIDPTVLAEHARDLREGR